MSIKILLADDSITIQKVIGIIFGGEDYSLTVVDNGKAAIDKALENAPDILLIDALMPGITGYEVCERIRSTPALAAKPILLLTGSFEPFDEDKAKACGADDFIAKPFESQQIIAKVIELCERAAARAITAPPEIPAFAAEPAAPFQEPEAPPLPIEEPAARPKDIWEAFTPDEPAPDSVFEPTITAGETISAATTSESASFPWVPIDEQAFSFEEVAPAAETPSPFSQSAPLETATFGEISFEAEIEPPAIQPEAEAIPAIQEPAGFTFETIEPPVSFAEPLPELTRFEEIAPEDIAIVEEAAAPPAFEPFAPAEPVAAAETFAPLEPPAPAMSFATPEPCTAPEPPAAAEPAPPVSPAPASLSEEQLRAAIAGVSKDVIERIVWEVVPDLAETLIKEAIRRIREGQ